WHGGSWPRWLPRNVLRPIRNDAIQYVGIDRSEQLAVMAKRVLLDLVRHHRIALAADDVQRRLHADELRERRDLDWPAQLCAYIAALVQDFGQLVFEAR